MPVIRPCLEPLASLARARRAGAPQGARTRGSVLDDARPDDIEDFLLAIDRVVELEHDADHADRAARAAITLEAPDFRVLQVANDISHAVEGATDALMRSALQLRDRILAEVITR